MAASLILSRRVSSVGISRTLQGLAGNVGPSCLHLELKVTALINVVDKTKQYSSSSGTTQLDFTYLTSPHTWYPKARSKQRKVILHMGPINSGKTYNALKRLESSPSGMIARCSRVGIPVCLKGIYCGPLRLLAWEVAKVPCDLITGKERDEVDDAKHKAVIVEMADVDRRLSGEVKMAEAENQEISLAYPFNFTVIPESQTQLVTYLSSFSVSYSFSSAVS